MSSSNLCHRLNLYVNKDIQEVIINTSSIIRQMLSAQEATKSRTSFVHLARGAAKGEGGGRGVRMIVS